MEINPADYQLGDLLGRGGFGSVYKALNKKTGEICAIKTVNTTSVSADQLEVVQMEIDLLSSLEHENIVRYLGSFSDDDNRLCIILEYVETGSLQDVVKKFGAISESLMVIYIEQVLQGLAYLHRQGVIHRDIKGANILITKTAQVKLADFGVATMVQAGTDNSETDEPDVAGTPYWMAPEIIQMSGASDRSDIWSVGCTILELLTGDPPYFDLPPMSALFRIVMDEHPPIPDAVTPALKDFLLTCFRKDPLDRASASALLSHTWITSRSKRNLKPTLAPAAPKPVVEQAVQQRSAVDPTPPPRAMDDDTLDDLDFGASHVHIGATSTNNNNNPPYNTHHHPSVQSAEDENDLASRLKVRLLSQHQEMMDEDLVLWDDESLGEDALREAYRLEQQAMLELTKQLLRSDPQQRISLCEKLITLLRETPALKEALVSQRGVLQILNLLEVRDTIPESPLIRQVVLELLNVIISDNTGDVCQHLCLVGAIPTVVECSHHKQPLAVRYQAAVFVTHMFDASDLTRQMVIACRGPHVIVNMLNHPYAENAQTRSIVRMGIRCAWTVLHMESRSTPAKDFCVLFAKDKLADRFGPVLVGLLADPAEDSVEIATQLADMLLTFAKADGFTKSVLIASDSFLLEVLPVIPEKAETHTVLVSHLVKAVYHVTINADATALQRMEENGTVNALVKFLDKAAHKPGMRDMQHHALQALFKLLSIDKQRQARAAEVGLVSHLKNIIETNNPLKDFAIPIFCNFAHAAAARDDLWRSNGVEVYLRILKQDLWQASALESLRAWMAEDDKVQSILVQPHNIALLMGIFDGPQSDSRTYESFYQIILSQNVNRAVGRSGLLHGLIAKLAHPAVAVRLVTLKILRSIFDHHSYPALIIHEFQLQHAVNDCAASTESILVKELAKKLAEIFQNSLTIL